MAHMKQEDGVLINIKCDYIRKKHRKLLQKDSPGRLPRATYLKLYQKLMLPVVHIERLPDSCLSKNTRIKVGSKVEKENGVFQLKSVAKTGSVYDFDSNDFCEKQKPYSTLGQRSRRSRSKCTNSPYKKRGSNEKYPLIRNKLDSRFAKHKSGHCNRQEKPNHPKRNPYAVIYKFLKGHKHLQSKLLSTYKGTSSRMAPFKIVINATSSGCKMKKIPFTPNKDLSDVSYGCSKAATTTRSLGIPSSKTDDQDKYICRRILTSSKTTLPVDKHGINGKSINMFKSVDESDQSMPKSQNYGKGITYNRKRKYATPASCSKQPKRNLCEDQLHLNTKHTEIHVNTSDKEIDSSNTDEGEHLNSVETSDADVIIRFKPTNGSCTLSKLVTPESPSLISKFKWQKYSDARWNRVMSSHKEVLRGKSMSEVDYDQTKFENGRKSALEVIRDLFFEAAAPVNGVIETSDTDEDLSAGDKKSSTSMDIEKKISEPSTLDMTENNEERTGESSLHCVEKEDCAKESRNNCDIILDIVDQLIENVLEKVASESYVNLDIPAQTKKLSPCCQRLDVQGGSPDRTKNGLFPFETSNQSSEVHSVSADTTSSSRIRKDAEYYNDSPLSTATECLVTAHDIKARNDSCTESTNGPLEVLFGEIICQDLTERQARNCQSLDLKEMKLLMEQLLEKVCEKNQEVDSIEFDSSCIPDINKGNAQFSESSSSTDSQNNGLDIIAKNDDNNTRTIRGNCRGENCSIFKKDNLLCQEVQLQCSADETAYASTSELEHLEGETRVDPDHQILDEVVSTVLPTDNGVETGQERLPREGNKREYESVGSVLSDKEMEKNGNTDQRTEEITKTPGKTDIDNAIEDCSKSTNHELPDLREKDAEDYPFEESTNVQMKTDEIDELHSGMDAIHQYVATWDEHREDINQATKLDICQSVKSGEFPDVQTVCPLPNHTGLEASCTEECGDGVRVEVNDTDCRKNTQNGSNGEPILATSIGSERQTTGELVVSSKNGSVVPNNDLNAGHESGELICQSTEKTEPELTTTENIYDQSSENIRKQEYSKKESSAMINEEAVEFNEEPNVQDTRETSTVDESVVTKVQTITDVDVYNKYGDEDVGIVKESKQEEPFESSSVENRSECALQSLTEEEVEEATSVPVRGDSVQFSVESPCTSLDSKEKVLESRDPEEIISVNMKDSIDNNASAIISKCRSEIESDFENESSFNEQGRNLNNDANAVSMKETFTDVQKAVHPTIENVVTADLLIQVQGDESTSSDKPPNDARAASDKENGSNVWKDYNLLHRSSDVYSSDSNFTPPTTLPVELNMESNEDICDLKSSQDNLSDVENKLLENDVLLPATSAKSGDSGGDEWENASNDELQIDLSGDTETAKTDTLCQPETAVTGLCVCDKGKQIAKRKRRKFKFTTKKHRSKGNPSLTESSESVKRPTSAESEDKVVLKLTKSPHRKGKTSRKATGKKMSAKDRKTYPRRKKVFSLPTPSDDQSIEDKAESSRRRKRKYEDIVVHSDDRLSVEFSKHNWFLTKYKTTLKATGSYHSDESINDDQLETAEKPKRPRRYKKSGGESKTEENAAAKKKPRKKRVCDRSKKALSFLNIEPLLSGNEGGASLDSTSVSVAEKCNIEVKEPGAEVVSSGIHSNAVDPSVMENDDDAGEIKILEVVSLAGYIQQSVPDSGSPETTVNEDSAPVDNPESDQPLNMTINKNSRDVINPNAKKLDQNDVLKTTSDEEESKPLDLSVKPAFDSALDLSFKLNEEAGSGADPRQNILDSSYACFNIPKPESSCISTSGHQEPCSVTQSKRVDLLTQHVSYSTESKIVPVTSTSSTDSKETIQLPPNQHSVPKLLESDIQSSPTAGKGFFPSKLGQAGKGEHAAICTNRKNVTLEGRSRNRSGSSGINQSLSPIVSSLSTTLSTPNIFGSNTVARFVGPFSRRSVPPNVTVSRGLDPFPGKYVSANNTNNVSETVDTFLIKSQPTNNMNTATQAITSFPVPTIPLNNDISILTLPMHRTNSVLPHHCNSITKPLQPPMELPTIPQEARNKTQISNSVQQVSAVTMLPPGLPQQSPNQSGSLNSNISRTQFSPGVTTSVPSYCINTTRSAPSIPHSISHPTQRRLNNPNMTYPGRFAVSSDDQVRIPAGPGIPNSSSISEANHSCFVIEPADIQQVPVYQMSSCTETNVQSSVPIPGAFKTPDESRQQTALGSLPHTFTNQRVMHQQQCHQQHAQQQQQQQLLLQQQQQQRQRLHQLQELGQLNSMTSHSGALSERFQGLTSVHAGSGPRQNISYNTAGTPVQQPGSSSSSSTANNILFCTQDGGALVCTIDEQDMRVVSINCDVCGSKAKFLCSNCKNVAYCSAKCQFNAWKSHRANCLVK